MLPVTPRHAPAQVQVAGDAGEPVEHLHLVRQLHLAELAAEVGLPGGAPVQAPPVVDADHHEALAGQQVRPQLPQALEAVADQLQLGAAVDVEQDGVADAGHRVVGLVDHAVHLLPAGDGVAEELGRGEVLVGARRLQDPAVAAEADPVHRVVRVGDGEHLDAGELV